VSSGELEDTSSGSPEELSNHLTNAFFLKTIATPRTSTTDIAVNTVISLVEGFSPSLPRVKFSAASRVSKK